METIEYVNGRSVKIRKDGFIVLSSLQLCLLGKSDGHFTKWCRAPNVKNYIETLATTMSLIGNDTEIKGIYRGKEYNITHKPKGILEYYTDDGNNQSISFIHKKLAYYYVTLKNPTFALWIMSLFDRYVEGDTTLIDEVVEIHNKKVIGTQHVEFQEVESNDKKRKYDEMDHEKKIMEFERYREETKRMAIETKRMEKTYITETLEDYKKTITNPTERELLHFKDIEKHIFQTTLNNMLNHNFPLMITQGEPQQTPVVPQLSQPNTEISIPLICQTLKKKPKQSDYSKIGKIVASLYRQRYPDNPTPPKGKQYYDGKVIEVNTYYEKDRDIVEKAVNDYFNKPL